jgi:hypothetical protein
MNKFIKVREVTGSHANARLSEKYVNIASIVQVVENETIGEVIKNSPVLAKLDSRVTFSTIHLNVGMHGSSINVVGTPQQILEF